MCRKSTTTVRERERDLFQQLFNDFLWGPWAVVVNKVSGAVAHFCADKFAAARARDPDVSHSENNTRGRVQWTR